MYQNKDNKNEIGENEINQNVIDENDIDENANESEIDENDITLKENDMKDIIQRINKLHDKEKVHILNILKMSNIEYTKNTNGYFFNFLKLNNNIIQKICNCLDLIEKNSNILKEMEKRRFELINYYKCIIEERLINNIKKKREEYKKKLYINEPKFDIVIKRKPKIKYIRKYDQYIDPDILIKEYTKSKNQYSKDSVYHKLVTSMKLLKSKKSKEIKKYKDDNNSYVDTKDTDNDSIKQSIEYENSLDDISSILNEDFYNESNEEKDDEIDKEIDEYVEIEDNDISIDDDDDENLDKEIDDDDEIDEENEDKKESNESVTDIDFLYYKNLLKNQGYQFNDNKNCILMYQEYIY